MKSTCGVNTWKQRSSLGSEQWSTYVVHSKVVNFTYLPVNNTVGYPQGKPCDCAASDEMSEVVPACDVASSIRPILAAEPTGCASRTAGSKTLRCTWKYFLKTGIIMVVIQACCLSQDAGVWILFCLMKAGLSKDIWCYGWTYSFLGLQISKSDIRPHVKWAVNLVSADGYFNIPQGLCGYVWVNIPVLYLSPSGMMNERYDQACCWVRSNQAGTTKLPCNSPPPIHYKISIIHQFQLQDSVYNLWTKEACTCSKSFHINF